MLLQSIYLRLSRREYSRDESSDFAFETRYIESLYETYFGRYKTQNISHVEIELIKNAPSTDIRVVREKVAHLEMKFDAKDYWKLEKKEKQKVVIDLMQEGVMRVCDKFGWAKEPFENAYKKVKEAHFKNEWIAKKKALHPSKKYVAEILCNHDMEKFTMHLLIKDRKKNILKNVFLKDEKPDELIFIKYFGGIEWISDTVVRVLHKDWSDEKYWDVDVGDVIQYSNNKPKKRTRFSEKIKKIFN